MQLIHHGFACNTDAGFSLAFAHGNIEDTTTFKTVDRDEMVAPAVKSGAKVISARDLAFAIIEAFQNAAADDDEISTEREAEAEGLEDTLAMLWASENGLLREIRLVDVPSTMMSHLIRGVRSRLVAEQRTLPTGGSPEPRVRPKEPRAWK
ncbi:hypothetical protein MHU86_23739 [Fragilaria crotonensis]|nr:hypothetical protein MHU86_23739 [Fragilaria crotonensis]